MPCFGTSSSSAPRGLGRRSSGRRPSRKRSGRASRASRWTLKETSHPSPQAQEIARKAFGARPVADPPEIALLPIWKFEVTSNQDGSARPVWVDGYLGTVLRAPPESL